MGFYIRPHDEEHGSDVATMPLYGIERAMGEDDTLPAPEAKVSFRTFDDDGGPCHAGTLDDDDGCENQSAALRWSEADMGGTRIEVFRDGAWEQEIA